VRGDAYRLVLQRRCWVGKRSCRWMGEQGTTGDHSCRSKISLFSRLTAGSLNCWAAVKRWPRSASERT